MTRKGDHRPPRLRPQEVERALRLKAWGKSNRQIASKMHRKVRHVEWILEHGVALLEGRQVRLTDGAAADLSPGASQAAAPPPPTEGASR